MCSVSQKGVRQIQGSGAGYGCVLLFRICFSRGVCPLFPCVCVKGWLRFVLILCVCCGCLSPALQARQVVWVQAALRLMASSQSSGHSPRTRTLLVSSIAVLCSFLGLFQFCFWTIPVSVLIQHSTPNTMCSGCCSAPPLCAWCDVVVHMLDVLSVCSFPHPLSLSSFCPVSLSACWSQVWCCVLTALEAMPWPQI